MIFKKERENLECQLELIFPACNRKCKIIVAVTCEGYTYSINKEYEPDTPRLVQPLHEITVCA